MSQHESPGSAGPGDSATRRRRFQAFRVAAMEEHTLLTATWPRRQSLQYRLSHLEHGYLLLKGNVGVLVSTGSCRVRRNPTRLLTTFIPHCPISSHRCSILHIVCYYHIIPHQSREPVVLETVSISAKLAFGSWYKSASRKSLAICS